MRETDRISTEVRFCHVDNSSEMSKSGGRYIQLMNRV